MSSSPHSTIIPFDSDIEDTFSSTNILNYFPASSGNIFPNPFEKISSPKDTEIPVGSPIPISPSSSVGSSSPVRSTTPPPDYLFDESIFAELDNSLWIISRPLESEPMPPKRTSTSATPTVTQDTIRQLITDSVATTLKAQAANMANTDNTNKNTGTSGTPEQSALSAGLKEPNQYSLVAGCAEENKVTFATGTLTDDALSWWNAYAQPMGVDQANQITWTELKRLLTNKYRPQTEVRKMEDEFYNLTVKGNDL
ncbi:reverse transcriptase domain-containing protein [Tanacetum coccineum]|uniref:Reverse transcriptase domain-containing protein n=1 Tax=Tanacetum coccineum TaxID=301880 RepID=A0ABQ4WYC5_9ASTR